MPQAKRNFINYLYVNIYIANTCWRNEEIASVKAIFYKILYQNHLPIYFDFTGIQINDMKNLEKISKIKVCS